MASVDDALELKPPSSLVSRLKDTYSGATLPASVLVSMVMVAGPGGAGAGAGGAGGLPLITQGGSWVAQLRPLDSILTVQQSLAPPGRLLQEGPPQRPQAATQQALPPRMP